MAYQAGASVCPRCGSSASVRTVRELFVMLSAPQQHAYQQLADRFGFSSGGPQPGPGTPPGPGSYQPAAEGYQAAGGGPPTAPGPAADAAAPSDFGPNNLAYGPSEHADQPDRSSGGAGDGGYDHYRVESSDRVLRRNRRGRGDFDLGDNLGEDIGGAVLGAALGFVGRRIGRKVMQSFEERVVPAMQARAEQTMRQAREQAAEGEAIAARYPDLRGCLTDEVIFLDGGTRTVAISELSMPVTMTQADAVVARLR